MPDRSRSKNEKEKIRKQNKRATTPPQISSNEQSTAQSSASGLSNTNPTEMILQEQMLYSTSESPFTPIDSVAPPLPSPTRRASTRTNRHTHERHVRTRSETPRRANNSNSSNYRSRTSTMNVSGHDFSSSASGPSSQLTTPNFEHEDVTMEENHEMQVEMDQAFLAPVFTAKRGRGRPKKAHNPEGIKTPQSNDTSLSMEDVSPMRTSLSMAVSTRLTTRHISMIEKHMQDKIDKYINRPWKRRTNTKKERNVDPCPPNCNCAHCFQEAKAFLAASEYVEKFPEQQWRNESLPKLFGPPKRINCHKSMDSSKTDVNDSTCQQSSASGPSIQVNNTDTKLYGCAAKSSRHFVKYYDSGSFGDRKCPFCGEGMLEGQYWSYKAGKHTLCCNNGQSHTIQMKQEFDERQKPPAEFKKLIENKDVKKREEFLENTLPLNNTFAFASVHSQKETRPEEIGGRMDTCKYNGEFSFCFSDLIAPTGPDGKKMAPTFAQVYTLTPDDAKKLRPEHFSTTLHKQIRQEIFETLEDLLRKSPFGRTFSTLGDKLNAAKKANKDIPEFQIVLLTSRELRDATIRNRPDCTVVDFERADAPTANQVAVVWINEDGLAPDVKGLWLKDKAGRMSELRSGMWQIDPACFPLLHPRGTPGWRWFMPKAKFENVAQGSMEQMEEELAAARIADGSTSSAPAAIKPGQSSASGLFAPVEEEDEEMDEEANQELDENEEPEMDNANDNVVVPQFDPQDKKKPMKTKSKGPEKNISQRHHARYNMAAFRGKDKNAFHWLWFARKLAEFFVISVTNRIERNELDMVKQAQERINLREVIAKDYIAALEGNLLKQGKKLGRVFMMPSTFAGSRQYFQKAYADLMTIVRRLGNPTWFVTFTGNPSWPEIISSLQDKQQFMHRADIVCQIFMDKLKELIVDLTQRHILGKVAGWCYSIEHQKRGMPHVHMLLILDRKYGVLTPKEVDEYICARVPYLPKMEDNSLEANQQRRYWYSVTQNMMHDCNAACLDDRRRCSKNFPKPFTEHTVLSAVTYTNYVRMMPSSAPGPISTNSSASGPINAPGSTNSSALGPDNDEERGIFYKRLPPTTKKQIDYEKQGLQFCKIRRTRVAQVLDDSRVVPHNPYLLLKYACHINVEYVFGQKACKYIFKYILKGFEKAYVKVEQPGADPNTMDYDEIAATFKVRYMTALEAYMRISSNKIVNMSHNIYTLTVHEEKGQTIVIEEGHEQDDSNLDKVEKDTMLTGFFKLCQTDAYARQFRYDEIPYFYTWSKNTRMWTRRKYPIPTDPFSTKMFVRMFTVSPKRKELFAIRALLLFRPGPKSYADLRTINGVEYQTFQEAAEAACLLESDDFFIRTMEDACAQIKSHRRLQHYFAMLLFHCIPSNAQFLFDHFLNEMNPLPPLQHPSLESAAKRKQQNEVMCNLEYYFRCLNTTCSEMGLAGLPTDYDHDARSKELEEENLWDDFYGDADRKKTTPAQFALSQLARLNEDQSKTFEQIAASLSGENEQKLFFIEGAGGCGKTFLYNTLIRWVLAGKPLLNQSSASGPTNVSSASGPNELKKGSVISCATTGIAALLLIGGGTVHRLFRIPNDVDSKTKPRMKAQSADAERIRNAELIIIDEISMLHRDVFNYLNILLKDICLTNQPFGGKTIILGGDWKQLTPVVPGGNRHDQVAASIKKDTLFSDFKTLRLTKNMRAERDQIKLCEWLIKIGNGQQESSASGLNLLQIPAENQSKELEEIIDFCFPSDVFNDPFKNTNAICDNALLCPRNDDVEQINNLAMRRLTGIEMTSCSIDAPLDSSDPQDHFSLHRSDFNIEAVHNEMPTGLPPHKLTVKLGAPVMLIKNIDVAQGLCNGTRLQVMGMNDHNLHCRILTGPKSNMDIYLPKVKFEYGTQKGERGLRFRRIQFPVRPCFAMTVNKAQGQTLKRVGLVLHRNQCFSHGQIYVALSRVTNMSGIRVYSPEYDGNVVNVVYNELLDETTHNLDDDEQFYDEIIFHDDDNDEY